MKALRAIPLLLLSFAWIVCGLAGVAQRSGAAGRGVSPASGGSPHLGGASHPGFSPPARGLAPAGVQPGGRFGSPPGVQSIPAGRGRAFGAPTSMFPAPGITSTRPVYFSNGIARYGEPGQGGEHERGRYGARGGAGIVTFGFPVYLGSSDLGFGYDPEFLEATENPNIVMSPAYTSAPDAFNPQPEPSAPADGAPETGSAENQPTPPPPYVAAPERHAPPLMAPSPLPEEDAVTIIFKDGRPSEQIRNYALTRTALYITAGRVRTIPIDQIDLAATEKINEKAGVEFHLPSTK